MSLRNVINNQKITISRVDQDKVRRVCCAASSSFYIVYTHSHFLVPILFTGYTLSILGLSVCFSFVTVVQLTYRVKSSLRSVTKFLFQSSDHDGLASPGLDLHLRTHSVEGSSLGTPSTKLRHSATTSNVGSSHFESYSTAAHKHPSSQYVHTTQVLCTSFIQILEFPYK